MAQFEQRLEQRLERGLESIAAMVAQHLGANVYDSAGTTPVPPIPMAPQPPVQARREERNIGRMRDFLKMRPRAFKGIKNPIEAEEWLVSLGKIFDFLGCSDVEKVSMATYMLQGQAEYWWGSTKVLLTAQHPVISWDAFSTAFRKQYVPLAAQQKLRMDFLSLVQGNMTVDEYESKFTMLMRYDPETF